MLTNEAWIQYQKCGTNTFNSNTIDILKFSRRSRKNALCAPDAVQIMLTLYTWGSQGDHIASIITPIRLMIEFCVSTEDRSAFRGIIKRAGKVPLKVQLKALIMENVSATSPTAFQQLFLSSICPEEWSTADEAVRIHAVLHMFHRKKIALDRCAPVNWKGSEVALAFFIFLMQRLRRQDDQALDEEQMKELEQDLQSADANWLLIHYMLPFCKEYKFDGQKMKDYWDGHTNDSAKINTFGQQMVRNICYFYQLKSFQFTRCADLMNMWYGNVMCIHLDRIGDRDDEKETEFNRAEDPPNSLMTQELNNRQVTRFDALKQHLMLHHDVDQMEIHILNQIVAEYGYESDTILLSENWMMSGHEPWNQLQCAPFIASFLRRQQCTFIQSVYIRVLVHMLIFQWFCP